MRTRDVGSSFTPLVPDDDLDGPPSIQPPAEDGDGLPEDAGLVVAARTLFGDRLPVAVAFARLLAGSAVERGLIGPREAPRLWDRHLLNCATLAELIEPGQSVIDVGSGAGLPGLAVAIARPDLSVTLVEPLQRRVVWLTEAVTELGLEKTVVVHRGRAEEAAAVLPPADVVTARAVAPLDRLAAWCLPLTRPGGVLLALKGESVEQEIEAAGPVLRRLGATAWDVRLCGVGVLPTPTRVVRVVAGAARGSATRGGRRRARTRSPRGTTGHDPGR